MASATADPLLHRILANVHHHPIISRWHASTGYLNLQRVRPVAVYLQDDLDAEDACGATAANAQDRWLAEAGMVLRDPPAMHMLAAEVVEILYRCAAFNQLCAYGYLVVRQRPLLQFADVSSCPFLCLGMISRARIS